MADKERLVPHEHQCYICGKLDGCTDKACEKNRTGVTCAKPSCIKLAKTAVIHLMGANHRVPLGCCGRLPSETPRQDRMVGDPEGVTCPGRESSTTGESATA